VAEQQKWEKEDNHIRKQQVPDMTKGKSKVSMQSEGESKKKWDKKRACEGLKQKREAENAKVKKALGEFQVVIGSPVLRMEKDWDWTGP
jgi:hypothetical protein